MNEGAATLAADGTVLYCNRHLAHLLDVPLEQIIGCPVEAIVADPTARVLDAMLAKARLGESITSALELMSTTGRCIPVQVSLSRMKSVEPAAMCMVVTDLTDLRARDELIAAGKLSKSILDSAAEAIAVCDEAGTVITGNDALERLCGINPLFRPFDSVLPLEVGDANSERAQRFSISNALSGHLLTGLEVVLRRVDAPPVSLLLSASPLRSFSSVAGCVVTLTNITDRKLAELALLQSEKLASVGRMASTIAHEINNPLEAVGNLLFLAQNSPQVTPEIKSHLDRAVEELDRVSHITQQALAFHRDANAPTVVDLREIIDSVLNLFASRLKAKDITAVTRYHGGTSILAMKGEIRQVVANLVSNCLDAVAGNGKIEIRATEAKGRGGAPRVRFSVADTGWGIESSRLHRIFEPFYTTKESVGVGLGLWVSKQIIDKHGAAIKVRSKPGAGTVFSISFPACTVALPG